MAAIVQSGIYFGFTKPELDAEMVKYKAAVRARSSEAAAEGGKTLIRGRLAGNEVEYAPPRGLSSLDEWRAALQDAFAQLSGGTGVRNTTVGRMR